MANTLLFRAGIVMISVVITMISVLGSLVVAYVTSRRQITVAERNKGNERKFDVYDKLMRLLSELNMDSAKSLNIGFLAEWYALSGVVRAYASEEVANATEQFVDRLHNNYVAYQEKQNKLHGDWFEGEPEYTEDGTFCGMREVFIGDDYIGYEHKCEQLARVSVLDSQSIHEELVHISNMIRREVGLKDL